ncbi:ribonuclease H-like domain-containing protein [Tricladium varicosporioides]|nr:ribonuclease H-like domain-containing protein [Hymenoscyphus varicosporioides]
MDETPGFKSLQEQIQAALIATTRTSGQISSEDLGFQRSLNPEVGTTLDEHSARLLELSTKLLKSAASISDLQAPSLEDADDVENNWRGVVDIIDSLLEKSDTCLDEYTGITKRKQQPEAEQANLKEKRHTLGNAFRTQNLVKPQLAFDIKPNNDDESPWKPLLDSKPHAILLLEESLSTMTNDFNQKQYKHPYETEILNLQYPETIYQKSDPIPYQPVETTSATFVDTEEGVLQMLEELKTAKEIAIDLEHHDARTYVGLTSLMQISTRHKDWIVDTLKPWRHRLQVLNEVFADPTIIKVFHGAFMDIIWLQRDLGLYIVGLFDTHWACRTLGYPGGSLAFLLKKFINFDADKKYQLADWRIRPLPEEMFFYARADTHYLLYIYDNVRNELIEKTRTELPDENRIEIVLQKSKEVSLMRYERQVYNAESGRGPGGWYQLLVKTPALFNNEQFAVFKAIHQWRDQVARTDDDSTNFVMPNSIIFTIARIMPKDMIALLGIAHHVSHGVKSRMGELLALIQTAKARGRDGPSMIDVLHPDSLGATAKVNTLSLDIKAKSKDYAEPLVAVVDEGQLRSNSSSFWGDAFGSSIWDPSTFTKGSEEIRLAIPLPQLTSEIWANGNGSTTRSSRAEDIIPLASPIVPNKQVQKDEAFVLKRGAKWKSDAISEPEEGETSGEYDISLKDLEDEENNQETTTKAERKALRNREKKAKKNAKAAAKAQLSSGQPTEGEEDEEPFDYSKAESVLHPKRNEGYPEGGRNKRQKPFDPYTKSADAPKGMRRAQTERVGKSHTFKS